MRQVLLRHHKARLELPLNDVSDPAATKQKRGRPSGREQQQLCGLCAIYAWVYLITTYVLSKNKNQKKIKVNELLCELVSLANFYYCPQVVCFSIRCNCGKSSFQFAAVKRSVELKASSGERRALKPPPCPYNLLIIFGKWCCKSRNCTIKMMCETTYTHTHMQTQLTNFHV